MDLRKVVHQLSFVFDRLFSVRVWREVVAVYEDYLIVSEEVYGGGDREPATRTSFYRAAWSTNNDGVTIAPIEKWEPVEAAKEWRAFSADSGRPTLLAFASSSFPVREVTEDGRVFLVSDGKIARNVMNGILFPDDVFAACVEQLNGVPVVIDHVFADDGTPLSFSANPALYRRVGQIRNAAFVDGVVSADFWIDVELTGRCERGRALLEALRAGNSTGVSIGVFTHEVHSPGQHDGEAYTHIVTVFSGDHVALLPDESGACGLDHGCGVPRPQPRGFFQRIFGRFGLQTELASPAAEPAAQHGDVNMSFDPTALLEAIGKLEVKVEAVGGKVDAFFVAANATREAERVELMAALGDKLDIALLGTFSFEQLRGLAAAHGVRDFALQSGGSVPVEEEWI